MHPFELLAANRKLIPVQAGPGVLDRNGSIRYLASGVLYLLLLDHPIDRQGRCRSCRRPSAMLTLRRRPCRILIRASYWLLYCCGDRAAPSALVAPFAPDIVVWAYEGTPEQAVRALLNLLSAVCH